MEINWFNLVQTAVGILTGGIGVAGFMVARDSYLHARREREHERDRSRARQEGENELGYVAELHERIATLEHTNDALRHELSLGSEQRADKAEQSEEFWQRLAMRMLGPLEESNRLSELARDLLEPPESAGRTPKK